MADVNGVDRTLAAAGTRVSPGSSGGELRVISDKYVANALANGSTITLGGNTIPAGARVYYAEVSHTGLGTSTTHTLDIGSDTIIAATGTATAGALYHDTAALSIELTDGGYPILTLGGANTAGSDNTIVCTIFYTCY